MEDGSLGFADISGSQSQLCLWLRNVNVEVGAGWERCGVIELLAPLILESSCSNQARVVGSAEVHMLFFVRNGGGFFTVN